MKRQYLAIACRKIWRDARIEDGQPRFSRQRLIFTFLPQSELSPVLALLLRQRVVVTITRLYAPPWWVPLLWKVAPLWLLFLLIFGMDTTRRWKW